MRTVLRWLGTAVLVLGALLYLYSAAFSWWASWGPPNPDPHAWLMRAYRHLGISFGFFSAAVVLFISLRPRKVGKSKEPGAQSA